MGKKKTQASYNDFLDGEKLRDNNEIRTSLQPTSNLPISPPSAAPNPTQSTNARKSKKPQLTHFLCLPLVTPTSKPQLQTALQQLKHEVEKSRVPVEAIRPPGTLHLTVGVMSLTDSQVHDAKSLLESLHLNHILGTATPHTPTEATTPALTLHLAALTPMGPPHKTSILYATPKDATQRLVPFAELLRREFLHAGLLLPDQKPLLLHATLLNTVYARPRKSGPGRDAGYRGSNRWGRDHHHDADGKYPLALDPREIHAEIDKDFVNQNQDQNQPEYQPEYQNGNQNQNQNQPEYQPEYQNGNQNQNQNQNQNGNIHPNPPSSHTFPTSKGVMYFDAKALVEHYRDFTWATDICVDRVQICKMGARKIYNGHGEVVDEEYEVVCEKGFF